MYVTETQLKAYLAEMATRVEMAGLKLDHAEIVARVEAISKRTLEDTDVLSALYMSHDQRIKKLKAMMNRRYPQDS